MPALDKCRRVPLAEATTPKNHHEAIVDSYWVVVEECVLVFENGRASVPQCNTSEHVTQRLRDRLYPGADVRLIPVVYVPQQPK